MLWLGLNIHKHRNKDFSLYLDFSPILALCLFEHLLFFSCSSSYPFLHTPRVLEKVDKGSQGLATSGYRLPLATSGYLELLECGVGGSGEELCKITYIHEFDQYPLDPTMLCLAPSFSQKKTRFTVGASWKVSIFHSDNNHVML